MRKSTCDTTRCCGERNYVEAVANLGECVCDDERRLRIALTEQRIRPSVFFPDYIGVEGARCATFGRCK